MAKPILLLEDADQNLAEVAAALREAGYDAVVLDADDDPILQFSVIRPELIFLSLLVDKATGACESIREDPDGAIVPIIFVGTGEESVASPADALAAGGDFFFKLPLDISKVLAKVKTYVGVGDDDGEDDGIPVGATQSLPALSQDSDDVDGLQDQTTLRAIPEELLAKAQDPLAMETLETDPMPRPLADDEDTIGADPPPNAYDPEDEDDGLSDIPDLSWTRGEATDADNTTLTDASDTILAELQEEARKREAEKARDEEEKEARQREEEEARKREEEEARKREEEEARQREEEEARQREEEEAKQREEEEARQREEEEARQREEEEARQREEEEARQREEEEARKREEEEARQREEEEARQREEEEARQREEEEARQREEEEARKREEEEARQREEEEARQREEEEARKREEEEARQREEEEARQREEEEARQREEEEARKREEEEARKREEEEAPQREEEEARQREEEEKEARKREEEEARKREEEEARKREEEEARKREEEEARKREEEEARKREEEEARKREEEEARKREEEKARKREEEEARQREEEEARKRRQEEKAAFLAAEKARQEESKAKAREEAALLQQEAEEEAERERLEAELRAKIADEMRAEAEAKAAREPGPLPEAEPRVDDGPMAPPRDAPRPGPQHDGSIPPLSGPVEDSGTFGSGRDLAAVVYGFWREQITGRVDFQSDGRQKSLFFERGGPVDAYSSQLYDRMEEFLYRDGKITRAQYQHVRVKQIRGARRIAAYLVSEGFLKPPELFEAVRKHLEEVVYGLFEWSEGTFQFIEEHAEEDDRVVLDLDPRAIIVEGVRRKYILAHLMERVGAPSSLLSPTSDSEIDFDALGLTAEERRVARLVDGTRSIEDLVFSTGLDALGVYHVLASLLFMGHVEVTIRGIEGIEADGTSTGDIIDRDRIRDKLEHVRKLDYFQVLGLPRTATTYEVERAYNRASHEFEAARFSEVIRRDMHRELQEIERVLDDAREVLKNDALRDAYARNVS